MEGREPPSEFSADRRHLAPNLCHAFHARLILLEQHNDAVNLLQFGQQLRDFLIQGLIVGHARQTFVEFLDGRLVAHTGAALPVAILTNSSYARSLDYLGARREFGARRELASSPSSLEVSLSPRAGQATR